MRQPAARGRDRPKAGKPPCIGRPLSLAAPAVAFKSLRNKPNSSDARREQKVLSHKQIEELEKGPYGICRRKANLADYTTFHIGGPCDLLLEPTTELELVAALRFLRSEKIPYYILGRGSNVLVRDGGFEGVILALADKYSKIIIDGNEVQAEAGASIRRIAHLSFKAGLTGMESLAGIPGSAGGGAIMNAGAFGSEMSQVLGMVRVIDQEGNRKTYDRPELTFGYRKSLLMDQGDVVSSLSFRLKPADPEEIQKRYLAIRAKRDASQPLNAYSAGSIFKRPSEAPAARLIDQAGLKGKSVNDAQISEKHAGFIVNRGHAKAADVLELIGMVTDIIQDRYGIKLETEIKIIGKDA